MQEKSRKGRVKPKPARKSAYQCEAKTMHNEAQKSVLLFIIISIKMMNTSFYCCKRSDTVCRTAAHQSKQKLISSFRTDFFAFNSAPRIAFKKARRACLPSEIFLVPLRKINDN